jgi:hypothetical protein
MNADFRTLFPDLNDLFPDRTRGQSGFISLVDRLFYATRVQHVMEKWCRQIGARATWSIARLICQAVIFEKDGVGPGWYPSIHGAAHFYTQWASHPQCFAELLVIVHETHGKPVKISPLSEACAILSDASRMRELPRRMKALAAEVEDRMRKKTRTPRVSEATIRKVINREIARRNRIDKRWLVRIRDEFRTKSGTLRELGT